MRDINVVVTSGCALNALRPALVRAREPRSDSRLFSQTTRRTARFKLFLLTTMRRRGNKSNKVYHVFFLITVSYLIIKSSHRQVPNVKLRPPQADLRQLEPESSVCWAQDSQLGSDDTGILDICPRPFKGVVVCATGVTDKVSRNLFCNA